MADTPSRVERVLNLVALLLDTSRPLTREEIVREVPGYPAAVTANRRAFERDKETLRDMGVPITVVPVDNAGQSGYRIVPDEYFLPDLGLTPDETAALRVAVTAVSLGEPLGEGALMKLGEVARAGETPIASLPLLPVLAPLFEAFHRRRVIGFGYRGERREVEPWGLMSRRGRWYLVGFDRGRRAVRVFRAERVEGEVEIGPGEAFDIPGDFRAEDHLEEHPWHFAEGEPVAVRVAVDRDHLPGLLAAAGDDAEVEVEGDAEGRAVVALTVTNRPALRTFVLGFLDHAEVLSPPEVRTEVVGWLESLAAGGDGP